MKIKFWKMHGTLNDFVVFHDLAGEVTMSPGQVARICDRRAGVGGDGVIVVRPSDRADFFMDYINADGSPAEMCGNGIRCLAKYVYDLGLTEKDTMLVETRAGLKTLDLFPGPDGKIERARVDMGPPIFDPEQIPVNLESNGRPILNYPIEIEGRLFSASILSMGNPHCVIPVDRDIDDLPKRFGPAIQTLPLFPAQANVEFIQVQTPRRLKMRVLERGSGETLSCGTGACAAAVAAILGGLVENSLTVELLGGNLDIEWKDHNSSVFMAGPVTLVFDGTITI